MRSDIHSPRFSAPADYHIHIECSLREVISGKSQIIIEESGFFTPTAFHILFAGSSIGFSVEQYGIRHWKADEKTNLMIKIKQKSDVYSSRFREICLTKSKSWRKTEPLFWPFRFLFALSLQVFAVEQFGIKHWKANGKTNLV